MFGDVEGPADVVPKVVVMIGRREGGGGAGIARPGVGVQGRVADIFIGGAVELGPATFGDNPDLAAGRASVFSHVIGAEDLHLLGGVLVGGTEAGAVGARARGGRAVIGDQVFRGARAVDVRRPRAESEIQAREISAANARR